MLQRNPLLISQITYFALLLAVAGTQVVCETDDASISHTSEGLNNFLLVEVTRGRPRWQLFPYLWQEQSVNITCPGVKEMNVYVARDEASLLHKYEHKDRAWCGFNWREPLKRTPGQCVVHTSPFGDTYMAVGKPNGNKMWPGEPPKCLYAIEQRLNLLLIAQGILGALLFVNAGPLSKWQPFRLTVGTSALTALSFVVVLLFMTRLVPSKRALAVGAAVLGSTLAGFSQWLFGSWIPSATQLMHSKVVWGFFAVSALCSLAFTYYWDSEQNYKFHNILKWAMKLLGLAAVGTSTTLPEASMALVLLLLLGQGIYTIKQEGQARLKQLQVQRQKRHQPQVQSELIAEGEDDEGEEDFDEDFDDEEEEEEEEQAVQQQSLPTTTISKVLWGAFWGPATPQTSQAARGAVLRTGLQHMKTGASSAVRQSREPLNGSAVTPRRLPKGSPAVSPLVQRGLILNEQTGRTIRMDGPTFTGLIQRGYSVDIVKGVITPPPTAASPSSKVRRRSRLAEQGDQ